MVTLKLGAVLMIQPFLAGARSALCINLLGRASPVSTLPAAFSVASTAAPAPDVLDPRRLHQRRFVVVAPIDGEGLPAYALMVSKSEFLNSFRSVMMSSASRMSSVLGFMAGPQKPGLLTGQVYAKARQMSVFTSLRKHESPRFAQVIRLCAAASAAAKHICDTTAGMKSSMLPQVRVPEELRSAAESVLAQGETLSSFIQKSVERAVEFRRIQAEFHSRGEAALEHYKRTGIHHSVDEVVAGLQVKLDRKRKQLLG